MRKIRIVDTVYLIAVLVIFFTFLWSLVYFNRAASMERAAEAQKNQENQEKVRIENRADEIASQIFYIRDKRTDICFAYVLPRGCWDMFSMTEVSCDKVRHLLPANQKGEMK